MLFWSKKCCFGSWFSPKMLCGLLNDLLVDKMLFVSKNDFLTGKVMLGSMKMLFGSKNDIWIENCCFGPQKAVRV
ncbi:hypothetical protein QJS10_CPB13g01141 [Acorus calamus]|uniref:Uncharacterized protein n=1 Tax=Acorus calamus TaxID=4465 RepID=A0AAV9DGC9_ACOCL|nr:hypothetical protein QJS10_CPB13g01141 [Acorus calamus]